MSDINRKSVLKKKLIGSLLILFSFFSIVSLFLYRPSDDSIIENVSLFEIFSEIGLIASSQIENPLGFFGAKVSGFFVVSLFGYTSLLLILSIGYWGLAFLRDKNYARAGYVMMYTSGFSIAISSLVALIESSFSMTVAGRIGLLIADFLKISIGKTGAVVVLIALLVVLILKSVKIKKKKKKDQETVDSEETLEERTSDDDDDNFLLNDDEMREFSEEENESLEKTEDKNDYQETSKKQDFTDTKERNVEANDSHSLEEKNNTISPNFLEPSFDVDLSKEDKSTFDDHENDEKNLVESESNSKPKLEPKMELKDAVMEKVANLDEREAHKMTFNAQDYLLPSTSLLNDYDKENNVETSQEELNENKRKLLEKLSIYKIEVTKIEATVGPRVTLFELELAPNVKVSRIVSLQHDLAMAMEARGIRILAPIPGKNAVGIEIPNRESKIVGIKSVLNTEKFKSTKFKLPIVFGRTISNEVFIDDLAKMPHLLVAGTTGSGKSVGINTILSSLLYHCSPDEVKLMLIDPKRVELFPYRNLKDHFLVKYKNLTEQIITDTSKAIYALKSVEKEMDERYELLARKGVRNILDYNERSPQDKMVYIVVIIDELADMMITAGKEVEGPIARLAQLARAIGIHLVVATQRPSVNVITGTIKANFPARMAYQVASNVDSRTILDTVGAEQLLGNGDMLYLSPASPRAIRIQNAFISTEEVEKLTEFISSQSPIGPYELPMPDMKNVNQEGKKDYKTYPNNSEERDSMFSEAAHLVVQHKQGSVSLLQRRLKLGFGRAARIMDQLEEAGIVGASEGSKPREVLVESEEELAGML